MEYSSGGRWLDAVEQLAGLELERRGQAEDVVQAEVALTSLDLTDVGPVQAAFVGEAFLRESELLALRSNTLAELSGGGRHGLGHENCKPSEL